jgi:hypothetical protein
MCVLRFGQAHFFAKKISKKKKSFCNKGHNLSGADLIIFARLSGKAGLHYVGLIAAEYACNKYQ